jgi:polyisoprenoid-binding protein YceI
MNSVHWSLKDMKLVKLLALAAVLAISPACNKDKKEEPKKEEPKKEEPKKEEPKPDPNMAKPDPNAAKPDPNAAKPDQPPPPPAEDTADWVKVHASHFKKTDTDPVEVKFDKVTVKKASFDPKKIEGGTATIEVDLAGLKSGDPKRDEHLISPDFLDAKKYTTATIEISNVKKKGDDKHFTADAKVKLHNVEKKYPVAFEVVDAKDDWIRIKGEHTFKRLDFKVGKKAGEDPKKEHNVADDLTVKMQLTLKKTP